ncbi:MAG: DUF2817 domain-containing protein [Planctomycetes bacterium]|nr:DUF2817 domain-containing protein [Planctomycetota bacterium]
MRPWLPCALGLSACVAPSALPPAAPPPVLAPANDGIWSALATSTEGRPIRCATLGHGPRRVLWVGGIHGDEREGALATAQLPAAFTAEPVALERVTLLVIEDLNPDGTLKKTRGNGRGIDLNRNFPANNFRGSSRHGDEPLSEPESRALGELVASWRPALVLVAHSWREQEFVNFDGPAQAVGARFAELSGFELRASDALDATPGSFGSWAGVTLGIPVLTIEFRRGRTSESAWERTRAATLAVIVGD